MIQIQQAGLRAYEKLPQGGHGGGMERHINHESVTRSKTFGGGLKRLLQHCLATLVKTDEGADFKAVQMLEQIDQRSMA
jgi:hypothetical protein